MSVWCGVDGTILIRKSKNISVKEVVRELLDGHDYGVSVNSQEKFLSFWEHKVTISLEAENSEAFAWCEKLCRELSKHAEGVDLVSNVRWVK